MQLVHSKNTYDCRIGGIISDGCFTISLQNDQFNIINRSRLKIYNWNRLSSVIQHTHRIIITIMIYLLWCLFL